MTKLLVVDDSMVSRLMVKQIVIESFPEWEIIEAKSGEDALVKSQNQHDIDVAILDYNMPGMSGLELADKLQENLNISNTALLTANVQDDIRHLAQEKGITFLNKPITEELVVGYLNGC